jgi:tetratricopeptide (TPR) repeat protein
VIAFAVTAIANREVEDALRFEQIQRKHAEESAKQALGALNRIYATFAPTRFAVTTDGTENQGSELARRTLSPEALVPLEELLKTYEAVAQSAESYAGLQEQAAEARYRIGEISQRLGRYESAAAEFRSAIRLYEHLVDRAPDRFRTRLARAHNELGGSLRAMQKFDDAKSANEEAVRVLKKDLGEEQAPPESRYELAYAYFMIDQRNLFSKEGGLRKKGPPLEAKEAKRSKHEEDDRPPPEEDGRPGPGSREPTHARARPILESLIEEHSNVPEYEFLLACCCKDTDPTRAEELLKRLVDRSPDVPDYRLQLAETLNRFGGAEQVARVQSAIGHARTLVDRYPKVPEYRAALARYLDHLGMTLLREGVPPESKKYTREAAARSEKPAREAVAIQTELYEKHPHVLLYGLWLSLMERSLGETLFVLGHDSEAWGRLESSIRRAEKLLAEHAQLEGVRSFLYGAYDNAIDVLRHLGEDRLADEMDRKKREIESKK